MTTRIGLEPKLFRGIYSSTFKEPTEHELGYVMEHSAEILKSLNKAPYHTREMEILGHFNGKVLECSCMTRGESTELTHISYAFGLGERMTDVPRDEWYEEGSRLLYVVVCTGCREWYLSD